MNSTLRSISVRLKHLNNDGGPASFAFFSKLYLWSVQYRLARPTSREKKILEE